MADDTPPTTIQMDEIKARADALGCFMQLFIAYNPETEMLMLASNAPDAENGEETALLLALAADNTAARMAKAKRAEKNSLEDYPPPPHKNIN